MMSAGIQKRDQGFGGMLFASVVFHLVVFFGFSYIAVTGTMKIAEQVYYVDVVNLPVASPQSGEPSSTVKVAPPQAAPAASPPHAAASAPAAPKAASMALKKQGAKKSVSPPAAATGSGETADEFQKRLSGIRRSVESEEHDEALAAIRARLQKGKGSSRAGMPGSTGTEAGSDYQSYLQSRLRDAFALTIASQSKNPEVEVRLVVDRYGALTGIRMERSTGDKLFEDSVNRAITKAKRNLRPPPSGNEFSCGVIFTPQGVARK